jgi:hypothetical protein
MTNDRIQYRPDIPNCVDVVTFLDWPEAVCSTTSPHPKANWFIDASMVRCGDWIIRNPDGTYRIEHS